jgi:hypothetical protein
MLHEHAAALSAASPANWSRRLIQCAKESGHYPARFNRARQTALQRMPRVMKSVSTALISLITTALVFWSDLVFDKETICAFGVRLNHRNDCAVPHFGENGFNVGVVSSGMLLGVAWSIYLELEGSV